MSKNKKHKHHDILVDRRRKIIYKKIITIFSFLIIFTVGLIYFSRLEAFQIKTISIEGIKYGDEKPIREAAYEAISGDRFFFVPKSSYLLFPKQNFENKLIQIQKSIVGLDLEFKNDKTLILKIKEKEPIAVLCNQTTGNQNCFIVDADGFIFAKEPIIGDMELVRFYGFFEGEQIGKIFDNIKMLTKVVELNVLLKKIGFDISRVETKDNQTYTLNTRQSVKLLIDVNDDPKKISENLNILIAKESLGKAQLENVDYIDLRFDNKVFYNLK